MQQQSNKSFRDDKSSITVNINGVDHVIDNVDPHLSLLNYIRSQPNLKGTKKSCTEGGCGACTVVINQKTNLGNHTLSVNSCLKPLISCDGAQVITVEGIGSSSDGYHPIQQRLADFHGSQCGFCSPGFVMGMYSVLSNNPSPTNQEIENYFDGNICRCTGYRPILAAFKTFSNDPDNTSKSCSKGSGTCPKTGTNCSNVCKLSKIYTDIEEIIDPKYDPYVHKPFNFDSDKQGVRHQRLSQQVQSQWMEPKTLAQVYQLMDTNPHADLVFGHTSAGINKDWRPQSFISLQKVSELKGYEINPSSNLITIGATNTISDYISILNEAQRSKKLDDTQKSVLSELEYMARRVASNHIRNAGSIAGNLMLANKQSFPSDLAISLAGIGSTVTIGCLKSEVTMELLSFVNTNMSGKLLKSISVPLGKHGQIFRAYKTAIRKVFAHAIVNAGFSAIVEGDKIVAQPILAFGNIRKKQARMTNTEQYLVGKSLSDARTLKTALQTLESELNPEKSEPRIMYRTKLAKSFFYKYYLSLVQNKLNSNLTSTIVRFARPCSHGEQSLVTDPSKHPVSAPITKERCVQQVSGEVVFTDDIPEPAGLLHAALVYSSKANADVQKLDASNALKIPGVTAFLSADDIPGEKEISSLGFPLFAKKVSYVGQPIGLIIAQDQETANRAAKEVVATYMNEEEPILHITDAIKKDSYHEVKKEDNLEPLTVGNFEDGLKESEHVIRGEVSIGSQYHFHLEKHSCIAIPSNGTEMRIIVASQLPDGVQTSVANILGIPNHDVHVEIKRCGGAYGGKLANSCLLATATAVAAKKLRTSVKSVMNIDDNMYIQGKRAEYYATYTVGVSKEGKLKALQIMVYVNAGIVATEEKIITMILLHHLDNCYYSPNLIVNAKLCKTNLPRSTSVRGPGWVPATFISEHIMEHVASSLGAKPEFIKRLNFYTKDKQTPDGTKLTNWNMDKIWDDLLLTSDFEKRSNDIQTYNAANRWTKRGISVVPVRFGMDWSKNHHSALVGIYSDGSVILSISGIEIGQGIETKVVQVAAYTLGIPIELVTVSPNTTVQNINSGVTGGSTTSELCAMAVTKACEKLNKRLSQIVEKLQKEKGEKIDSKKTKEMWEKLIEKALGEGINLQAQGDVFHQEDEKSESEEWHYQSYSAAVTEVQLDVLTGEQEILRTDILFDSGISLNPLIDLGQIEGAFTMGLGHCLLEEITYNEEGALFNHNSWEYKPPSAVDIPIDFRVSLVKDAPNPLGVLSSKATGEPPLCSSCSALFAIQHAVRDSKAERGHKVDDFSLSSPATPENVQIASCIDTSDLCNHTQPLFIE